MRLTVGYVVTSTNAFTVTGTSPVTVTKISGDNRITWNSATRKLDIAAGLPTGVYEVKLRASNSGSSFHTFIFTLTVEKLFYYLEPPKATGGTITIVAGNRSNPYLAEAGDVITLTITPDAGYESDKLTVYMLDNKNITVPVSGTGNTFTFTMPAHHITIAAVFSIATGIKDLKVDKDINDLKAFAQNGTLYLNGLTTGQYWSVYTVTGLLVNQGIAGSDKATIPLPGPGMYIVTSGVKTVKVVH
jgi:hypothetical protein